MTTTNTRTVRDHLVPSIEFLVAKVNKRAARIGVEGFTLTKGDAYQVPAKDSEGWTIPNSFWNMVPLTITGGLVKTPGYTLAGRVDFEDGAVIVNSRPGLESLTQFHKATPMCEHCNVARKRNAVFIFEKEAGGYLQVGRSCLKDFLGHDPEQTLFAAREYANLWGDIDDEIERDGGAAGKPVLRVRTLLIASAFAIRQHGFISRRQAEATYGATTTASHVEAYLLGSPKQRGEYKPDDSDEDRAAKVERWVTEELSAKANKSDYEHNAVELVAAGTVTARRIGLLASLVATWARINEARVARENEIDAYVGEVGQRRDFDAEYLGEHWFPTSYGSMCVARFRTTEGILVYKGASPFWPQHTEAGTKLRFKGAIKAHDEYSGRKQTIVTRCKLAAA